MGNVQSIQEVEKTNQIVNEIMKFDCSTLDIGDMTGQTDYIDFITEDILEGYDVMKGVDIYGRFFIVVKAYIVYKDIFIANTFTTFFQRYKNDNTCWMASGNNGRHLMETERGMSFIQIKLLRDLLYNRSVKIDNSRDTRIYTHDSHKNDIIDIHLGHKIDCLFLQEVNSINKPTTTMNERTSIKDLLCDLPEEFQNYLFEEFDAQEKETADLRGELERTRAELDKVKAELALVKSDLQIQKHMRCDLNILQTSTNDALTESVKENKHMAAAARNDLLYDTMNTVNMQLLEPTQSAFIPKPVLERQTNNIEFDCYTPESDSTTRLWGNSQEEDIEIDQSFHRFCRPRRERVKSLIGMPRSNDK